MQIEKTPSFKMLKEGIIKSLTLPVSLDPENETIKYGVAADATVLTCGCIISEAFAQHLMGSNDHFSCPLCKQNSKILKKVECLRNLFNVLNQESNEVIVDNNNGVHDSEGPSKKESLLSLFYSVANNVNEQYNEQKASATPTSSRSSSMSGRSSSIVTSHNKSSNHSVYSSTPTATNSSFLTNFHHSSTASQEQQQEHEEYRFVKCFPTYRRHFHYSTHSKFLKTKSKTFINNSISPNAKFFALLSSKKWEVFQIAEKSTSPPRLYCCGKSTGEYGTTFENLNKPPMDEIRGGGEDPTVLNQKIMDWEYLYCALSESYLVISGTHGVSRVFDLENKGRPIYIYSSDFPIRCLNISPNSKLIAYGITGKDRVSGSEQALIMLHKLSFNSTNSTLVKVDPITITFPYRDPINQVNFSIDSTYLCCSTALESRFLAVWVKNPDEPKLVMKSIRSLDTSLESEGITDIKMFPNNKFMAITSVAFNAPPILIDNNIRSINGLQTVAQPKMLLKLDEIGSSIHKCCVSPRNDAVVFLDRNGTVFLVFATKLNQESKRVLIVDQVSNAIRMREAASMSFSNDGHRLYIVDRKGILYINDFASGLPQSSEVTKCKPVT